MTLEILTSLARSRRERLLRESAYRRLLRIDRPAPASPRSALVRALRATGYAALSLGDALAETR